MCFYEAIFGRRVLDEVSCRADRAAQQLSATVGADVGKAGLSAVFAERAFERAGARLQAVGLKINVTTFTVWF